MNSNSDEFDRFIDDWVLIDPIIPAGTADSNNEVMRKYELAENAYQVAAVDQSRENKKNYYSLYKDYLDELIRYGKTTGEEGALSSYNKDLDDLKYIRGEDSIIDQWNLQGWADRYWETLSNDTSWGARYVGDVSVAISRFRKSLIGIDDNVFATDEDDIVDESHDLVTYAQYIGNDVGLLGVNDRMFSLKKDAYKKIHSFVMDKSGDQWNTYRNTDGARITDVDPETLEITFDR